ncbi:tetratricopeptide repeat protein [bacterium]|nr:tetratricopeptide repeat protein [bacterium]
MPTARSARPSSGCRASTRPAEPPLIGTNLDRSLPGAVLPCTSPGTTSPGGARMHHSTSRRRIASLVALTLASVMIAAGDLPARTTTLGEDASVNYLHAAAAVLQNDELDRAEEILEEALERATVSPEMLTLLAQVYHRQGKLEDAASAAEEALTMTPGYAPAHLQLGDVYREMGWLDSAIDRYRSAVVADAAAPAAKERLVRALLDAGRGAEAERECRAFLDDETSAALLVALGDVLSARRDAGGALAAYDRALEMEPRCALAHCGRAEQLAATGDHGAAAAAARRALAIDDSLARAHACLGMACAQGEDYLGAYGHAVKAEKAGIDMSAVWSLLQAER